jgi:hypothetical protein
MTPAEVMGLTSAIVARSETKEKSLGKNSCDSVSEGGEEIVKSSLPLNILGCNLAPVGLIEGTLRLLGCWGLDAASTELCPWISASAFKRRSSCFARSSSYRRACCFKASWK